MTGTRPRVAHVVVPVHDEAERLDGCLVALSRAVRCAARADMVVRATAVLDRCTDGSVEIAGRHAAAGGWLEMLAVEAGTVGAARAAGVEHARAQVPGVPPREVWVATTDADSRVPAGWLCEQVALAGAGADLVLGAVALDGEARAGLRSRWARRHTHPERHVFGANLGFRLSAHDRAGGITAVAEHEDVALVAALRGLGVPEVRARHVVVTSARLRGRTPGGLAGYLTALAGEGSARTPRVAAPAED